MRFYILVGLATLCLALDHDRVDVHVVAMSLGLAVFVYATCRHAIRITPAYAMIVLGILGGVSATYGVVWWMQGHYWATVGGAISTAALVWAVVRVMPAGIRMLRTVFGQG